MNQRHHAPVYCNCWVRSVKNPSCKMFKAILLLSIVALATCSLIPGGFIDVEVDREDVLTAANHAAKTLSKQFSSSYHHRLVKILKAQTQVVAGTNYKLDVVVGLTDCKKAEVEYEQIDDCELQEGISTYKKCTVLVYKNLRDELALISTGCILTSKNDL